MQHSENTTGNKERTLYLLFYYDKLTLVEYGKPSIDALKLHAEGLRRRLRGGAWNCLGISNSQVLEIKDSVVRAHHDVTENPKRSLRWRNINSNET